MVYESARAIFFVQTEIRDLFDSVHTSAFIV